MEAKLSEIAIAVKGTLITAEKLNMNVSGISTDSRNIQQGQLFIPLEGNRFDGHDFIEDACNKGAAAAIVARHWWDKNSDWSRLPVIMVNDTLKALQDIACYHRKKFSIPVIAVTGSNGKTTTKDLIASVLSEKFSVVKSKGSFNNEVGLPLTLLEITKDTQAVVVEMGMRGMGQIEALVQLAQPTMGVITNVAPVHLELLGTLENIAKAKGELIRYIRADGKVFLNGEDYWCRAMEKDTLAQSYFYGFSENCDYRAMNIKLYFEKSIFYLEISGQIQEIIFPIPGEHNILNALAAAGVAYQLGFDLGAIARGLEGCRLSEKRLQVLHGPTGIIVINDTYNANPISTSASLDILSRAEGNRKIAVLGDMYELGNFEEQGHRLVGENVVKSKIDMLVTVGKLASIIAEGAKDAGMARDRIHVFYDKADVIEFLKNNVSKGDCLLVKGSRAARMEDIVQGLI
ncbi:MAG: UDP-N-acetylmuramoyl-tripeptide--D-alanyl-D-alanine ligase [Bacillota bacterium]